MGARENVRTEVTPGDEVVCSGFDSRPPCGVNQGFTVEPVRDELLAGSIATEGSHPLSELSLATSCLDGAHEGGHVGGNSGGVSNVVFLHGATRYTRNLVAVNKESCFTSNKETCTVLTMAQPKKQSAQTPETKAPRKRVQDPEIGPDGLTMAQRLMKEMTLRDLGQQKLAEMCSQYYSAMNPKGAEDKVKQQHIFNILRGQESSFAIPLICAVLELREMWLQFGIGPKERHKAS